MKVAAIVMAMLLASVPSYQQTATSRVYVSLYPCNHDVDGKVINSSGQPVVTLYDGQRYGDNGYRGFEPPITVTKVNGSDSDFYFDARPGAYSAIVRSPRSPLVFVHNGPLIVIPGHDRHLFIAGCSVTDWHFVAAVAGALPLNNVGVSALVFEHKVSCGDEIDALDQKTLKPLKPYRRWPGIVDNGAYYANFDGYGKQDHTIALEFTGALFTRGAVLITDSPDAAAKKPPFIVKDITSELIETAARSWGKLVCVPGF